MKRPFKTTLVKESFKLYWCDLDIIKQSKISCSYGE